MNRLSPFHLAILVTDLDQARGFYGDIMGCAEGRSDSSWVDFDFFGHQLVCHTDNPRAEERLARPNSKLAGTNLVDGKTVPIPHFGIVLSIKAWSRLADKLVAAEQTFVIEPCIRFAGQAGEQGTFFLLDPSGNALEFKGFKDSAQLFATD